MDVTLLQQLIDEKLSASQIGERIGKSESTVRRLLKKHGLKTFRHIDRDSQASEKLCRYCQTVKPIEEFSIANVVNEVVYRRNKCNICYNLTKQARRKDLRDWVDKEVKSKISCQHCGNNDFRVLDFHHQNGKKEYNIGDMTRLGCSKASILKEIAKCIPLCSNCHRILHYEERNDGV